MPNIIELGTDDISKQQWKNHVKKAVRSSFEEEAKIKIKQLKKLSEGPLVDEDFECRPYLKELTLSEARTNFRFRSKMTDLAWNYKHDKSYEADLWKCESCQSCIETKNMFWCALLMLISERAKTYKVIRTLCLTCKVLCSLGTNSG